MLGSFVTVVFLALVNLSTSYIIFKINNVEDLKLIANFLVSDTKSVDNVKMKLNRNKIQQLNEHQFKNKILVKRIIPHGLAGGKYEYDDIFNTIYKPIVRLHKKFKLADVRDIMNTKINNKPGINVMQDFEKNYDLSNNIEESDKNEVWDGKTDEFRNIKPKFDLVYLIKPRYESQRQEDEFKGDEDMNLDKLLLRYSYYRAPLDKSGEANDPLAPGYFKAVEDKGMKDEKWMPHYPPWNYWTYKKTIHQDVCPGNQVKVGNMCIWIPPH